MRPSTAELPMVRSAQPHGASPPGQGPDRLRHRSPHRKTQRLRNESGCRGSCHQLSRRADNRSVQLQHPIVTHLTLQSLSSIAFLVLLGVLLATAARKLLERSGMDRRRLHTLRTIVILGIQFVTLIMILLVVFGAP